MQSCNPVIIGTSIHENLWIWQVFISFRSIHAKQSLHNLDMIVANAVDNKTTTLNQMSRLLKTNESNPMKTPKKKPFCSSPRKYGQSVISCSELNAASPTEMGLSLAEKSRTCQNECNMNCSTTVTHLLLSPDWFKMDVITTRDAITIWSLSTPSSE